MASQADIREVRENINEPTDAVYSDDRIGELIDDLGSTDAASARLWQKKADAYADLVNTSEAGSQRSLSDLYKHAIERAEYYIGRVEVAEDDGSAILGRAKTHRIRR